MKYIMVKFLKLDVGHACTKKLPSSYFLLQTHLHFLRLGRHWWARYIIIRFGSSIWPVQMISVLGCHPSVMDWNKIIYECHLGLTSCPILSFLKAHAFEGWFKMGQKIGCKWLILGLVLGIDFRLHLNISELDSNSIWNFKEFIIIVPSLNLKKILEM